MKTRRFGRSGWQIGQIGFGAWQLGGTWGVVDESSAIAALHHAWAGGVSIRDP